MHIAGSCPMWHHTCCMLPCSSADPRMSRLWRCHWFVASDHLHVCWQMHAGFSAGRTCKNASWAQVGQRCRGGQMSRIKIGRSNLFKPKNMWANVYCTKTATAFCFCSCMAQGLEHIVTNDQWTFNVFHFVHLSFCRFDDSFPARSQPGMTAAHMCQFRLRAELVRIADYIYSLGNSMAENLLLGFSCCMISGVGFAVNYLPVKSCDIGDGIFFSAAMSVTGLDLCQSANTFCWTCFCWLLTCALVHRSQHINLIAYFICMTSMDYID